MVQVIVRILLQVSVHLLTVYLVTVKVILLELPTKHFVLMAASMQVAQRSILVMMWVTVSVVRTAPMPMQLLEL
jgi:hypothetical protein